MQFLTRFSVANRLMTAVVLSALRPEHLPALVIAPRRVACEVCEHFARYADGAVPVFDLDHGNALLSLNDW